MGAVAVKHEPQGVWLNESEIAKKVKLHRQTVAARLEDLGYEPDPERSKVKLKVYWFDSEMEFAIKSAKDTVSAMKIRDLRATAELKEMKLAEARGDLVSVAETIEIVQRIVGKMYQEFTIQQPKRIAAKLAKAKNAAAIKKVLKADTDAIMKNLRQNFERFID
jgi:hypothetical protein